MRLEFTKNSFRRKYSPVKIIRYKTIPMEKGFIEFIRVVMKYKGIFRDFDVGPFDDKELKNRGFFIVGLKEKIKSVVQKFEERMEKLNFPFERYGQ